MKIVKQIFFAISLTALWCTIMPPYTCGILGIPLVFVGGLFLYNIIDRGVEKKKCITAGNKFDFILKIVFVLIGYYMIAVEFSKRWYLSSAIGGIAERIGISIFDLIWLAVLSGELVAIYAVWKLLGFVFEKKNNNRNVGTTDLNSQKLTVIDVCYAFFVSLSVGMRYVLNPWSDELPGTDSSVFLYMGRMLTEGNVAYKDIFDHKGLYLYFLNTLGIKISGLCETVFGGKILIGGLANGAYVGVWVIEVINSFVFALLIFMIAKLFTKNRIAQYLTVAAVLSAIIVCQLMTDGNLTEEYALPWITMALYICLKYLIKNVYRFYDILLLGFCFGILLFLRVNMIGVFAILPIIFVMMIRKKLWRDIGICIINFILGAILAVSPVLIYCFKTRSLNDMIQTYFEFNLEYCADGSMPIGTVAWLLFRCMTLFSILFVVGTLAYRKDKIIWINFWFYAVSLFMASMSGRFHEHYAIVLLPALIVPLVLLFDLRTESSGIVRKISHACTAMVSVALAMFLIQVFVAMYQGGSVPEDEVVAYLKNETSEDDNVLILGNYCVYYLQSDRFSQNRFFFQTPIINNSDRVYQEFLEELAEDMPDVIILIEKKEEILAEDNNLSGVYKLIEKWYDDTVYTEVDYNSFYTYTLNTGR